MQATATATTDLRAAFQTPPTSFVDVGHSRLAHRRFGRGPDVVFVHGWPLTSATFRAVVPRLADRYTCHLLDLPGTGDTVWSDATPISFEAHADTLRRAADRLGLSRYAVIAHDSGGLVARMLAAEDRRVAGLLLGDTEVPDHTPWQVVAYVMLGRLPGGRALLQALLGSAWLRRSPLGFGGCFRDPRRLEGEFHELFVAPLLSSRERAAGQMRLLSAVSGDAVRHLSALHARIDVPVRLVWGEDDPFFPVARARAMVPEFAGPTELVVLPGLRLFAHEEDPAAFAREAVTLLAQAFPS
jgi:pimeloyl-ACP methyl ester carboxylesterase